MFRIETTPSPSPPLDVGCPACERPAGPRGPSPIVITNAASTSPIPDQAPADPRERAGARLATEWYRALDVWSCHAVNQLHQISLSLGSAPFRPPFAWTQQIAQARLHLRDHLLRIAENPHLSQGFGLNQPLPLSMRHAVLQSLSLEIELLEASRAANQAELNMSLAQLYPVLEGPAFLALQEPTLQRLLLAVHQRVTGDPDGWASHFRLIHLHNEISPDPVIPAWGGFPPEPRT